METGCVACRPAHRLRGLPEGAGDSERSIIDRDMAEQSGRPVGDIGISAAGRHAVDDDVLGGSKADRQGRRPVADLNNTGNTQYLIWGDGDRQAVGDRPWAGIRQRIDAGAAGWCLADGDPGEAHRATAGIQAP
jgi:hypothetical protein